LRLVVPADNGGDAWDMMMAVRWRWGMAGLLFLAASAACDSAPSAERDAAALSSGNRFVVEPLPEGWSVAEVATASPHTRPITNVLYRPNHGSSDGPLLILGVVGDDDFTPNAAGGQSLPELGLGGVGRLVHYGAFTVVDWYQEVDPGAGPLSGLDGPFLIARGVADDVAVNIARSARFGSEPSIPAAVLPEGWTRVARSASLPRQSLRAPLRISLDRHDPNGWAVVMAYRLGKDASAVDNVIAEVQRAALTSPGMNGTAIAERNAGDKTILALSRTGGPAPVEELARATRAATNRRWQQFRREATGKIAFDPTSSYLPLSRGEIGERAPRTIRSCRVAIAR
jgi:hypothetical protein